MTSRFDVTVEDVQCASRRFSIAMVHKPERLLDAITPETFAEDERLPYWAELWTSALVLAEQLIGDATLKGRNVLELGCGLGLAGIAAVEAGAHVTMTDYDEDALLFARWNAATNLDAAAHERVAIENLDWREPPAEMFDLIIGADIVYERRHYAPLLALFAHTLRPGGHILLAEPDRSVGNDFFTVARQEGLTVSMNYVPCERRGRTATVRLVTLKPEARA
jgi:predicted nicotinamide N-methyase